MRYHARVQQQAPGADVERILSLHRAGAYRGIPPTATHRSELRSPFCGDRIVLGLAVDDEGKVLEAGYDGELCAVSSAVASLLCGALKGEVLDDLRDWPLDYGADLLGVRVARPRLACARLPIEALRRAIERKGKDDG